MICRDCSPSSPQYYAGSGLLWKVVGNSDSREYARLEDYEASGKTGKLYQEGGSVLTVNTYDAYSGRLLSLRTENANVLQYKQYSYTKAGDVSQIVDNVKSVTHTYAYDKLHRLIGEGGTDTYANLTPAIVTNTYDTQNGPIHAVAETDINQVDYSYTYDANGNLTEGPDFTNINSIGREPSPITRTIKPRMLSIPTAWPWICIMTEAAGEPKRLSLREARPIILGSIMR